jgi:tol-pal system protein YbgF
MFSKNIYSVIYALSVTSVLLLSGCVSTNDIGKMQWDINELKNELKKAKGTAGTSYQKSDIDNKMKAIEERQSSSSKTVSDLLIQIQSLTAEFQVMTGRFEESRYFSEKSTAELLQNKDVLIARVKELELAISDLNTKVAEVQKTNADLKKEVQESAVKISKQVSKPEAVKKKTTKAPPSPVVKKEDSNAKIKDLYMAGYQALRGGKPEKARENFMSVLNDYPKNEYSDNARFWIGESYYKDGSYEDAILAYEDLFKNHPDSDKIPGAMLKQGLAFYSLKDQKTGKIILEKLIEKYPDSEQAKLAKKKIRKPVPPKKKK